MTGGLRDAIAARRPQSGLRIVDAHAHLGPYGLFFIPDSEASGLVGVMDYCGVSRAVFSSHLALQVDTSLGNRITADAVSRFPDRLAGYLVLNPWQDIERELAARSDDSRFVGIKVHPDMHQYPLTGARYRPVWEYAEATGCPVLTHTWHGSDFDGVPEVRAVIDRYPRLTVLAGHSWVRPEGFDDAIETAQRYPNLVLELCGSFNHRSVIERMVGEVGAAQVAHGSDFPFIDMRPALGRLAYARLAPDDLAAVAGGTIERALAWRGVRTAELAG